MTWRTHPYLCDYAVSTDGQIKRITTKKGTRAGKILQHGISSSGYAVVSIGGRMRKVHVMMLETFVRLRLPEEQARHLNDSKLDNRIENLKWGTRADNYADRVANGGGNQGSRHGKSKLTEANVIAMRTRYPDNSIADLADEFDVDKFTVYQVVNRERWKHV